MRKLFLLFLFIAFISCVSKKQFIDYDRDGMIDREEGLGYDLTTIGVLNNLVVETSKVDLRNEMISLFSPDNFDCNCDQKLKKSINEFNKVGYIPSIIEREIKEEEEEGKEILRLNQNGANALVHTFKIKNKDGSIAGPYFTSTSPSVDNFEILNYIESRNGVYNNFYYTIDCNGYLTGLINAGISITNSSLKISASAASKSDKSLVVIKGLIYSPLYQAYKGEGIFLKDKDLRKKVLTAILHSATSGNVDDSTEILLTSNYLIIVASNSGNSSFNGEASLNSALNANFILGGINSSISGNTNVGRVSNYSRYRTYVLGENIKTNIEPIKIKQIKDLISSL